MKICCAKSSAPIRQEKGRAGEVPPDIKYLSGQSLEKKQLISAAIVAFVLFVVLNTIVLSTRFYSSTNFSSEDGERHLQRLRQLVMNGTYEATQLGPWPWWVARAYFTCPTPDIVVMGDSQMNAAFIEADAMTTNMNKDCTVDRSCISLNANLQKYGFTAEGGALHSVNLAIGGAMPSDYYLMSKAFFSKHSHPKLVVISLSPRSFLDATLTSASATDTFQLLAPMVDLGGLIDCAFTNPFEKYFWLLRNKFTLFVYQQDIALALHNYVTKHFPVNKIGKGGLLQSQDPKTNRQPLPSIYSGSGFVGIGSSVVGPNARIPFRGNREEYQKRFAHLNSSTLENQYAYFQSALQYLKALGVPVIVVDMPMLEPVRALLPDSFWHTYRSLLQNACVKNGACLLDLSDSKDFPEDEYIDYVHLNATGGKHFTDILASYIKRNYQSH